MDIKMVKRAISDVDREIIVQNLRLHSRKQAGASDGALNAIVHKIHKLDKERRNYIRLLHAGNKKVTSTTAIGK